jgi:hypothetical protein
VRVLRTTPRVDEGFDAPPRCGDVSDDGGYLKCRVHKVAVAAAIAWALQGLKREGRLSRRGRGDRGGGSGMKAGGGCGRGGGGGGLRGDRVGGRGRLAPPVRGGGGRGAGGVREKREKRPIAGIRVDRRFHKSIEFLPEPQVPHRRVPVRVSLHCSAGGYMAAPGKRRSHGVAVVVLQ